MPDSVFLANFGFMIVALLLLRAGLRLHVRSGRTPAPIIFPLVWSGLTVWAVGAAFGIATAFMYGGILARVLSFITAAISIWLFVYMGRLYRRIEARR